MTFRSSKLFLECYGALRFCYGVAQLIGMTAAFFLLEFIIAYPDGMIINFFNEDLLFLIYFAVFLRSCFFIASGIGIMRVHAWARPVLLYGWPVLLLVTLGLLITLYQEWQLAGYVDSLLSMISWPRLFMYLGVVAFDFFIVYRSIGEMSKGTRAIEEAGGRLSGMRLFLIFISVTVFFILLFYFGRSVKQGFHKGYYHSSGERETNLYDEKIRSKSRTRTDITASKIRGETKLREQEVREDRVLVAQQRKAIVAENKEVTGGPARVSKVEEKSIQDASTVSTSTLFGYAGGVLICIAFLFQYLGSMGGNQQRNPTAIYALAGVGFFCWILYGLFLKSPPLYISSSIVLIICLGVILIQLKDG